MAKGNILKEAIADAKAVREVALANAKAALEEAFTPKLQSMLSAKLSEDLDEDMYDEDEKELDLGEGGMYYDEDEKDMDEMNMAYDEDEKDMDEMMYDEDEDMDEGHVDGHGMEEDSMDEEIDLEEILNELELEEGDKADEVDEAKNDDDKEEVEEAVGYPNYRADQIQKVKHDASDINQGLNESEEFNLDSLLKEINDLEEEEEILEIEDDEQPTSEMKNPIRRMKKDIEKIMDPTVGGPNLEEGCGCTVEKRRINFLQKELNESKKAFTTVKSELNEVNLLNSKLLYVNRIFKANTLDDAQKLRVVETLDKATSVKEAKLIYETVKNTFTISSQKKQKTISKKSIKENFKGMASKATGISRTKKVAPKKAVLKESNDMVARMQKLANISKISE
ncbi:hypothetical protein [uncultured virus]|uniref:Uncharacterized protein n=1 Tax=uncultured virus TaxID=340016 RepID=A0A218MMR5_9VIRU|nr:hypothetical protein [uncultured virus]